MERPCYLGLDDTVVEYEITSNRVDCFSILGIAREAAATFGKELVILISNSEILILSGGDLQMIIEKR